MELLVKDGAFYIAVQQAKQLLNHRRVLAVMGDRLTLCTFALASTVADSLVGAATTEEEGLALALKVRPC